MDISIFYLFIILFVLLYLLVYLSGVGGGRGEFSSCACVSAVGTNIHFFVLMHRTPRFGRTACASYNHDTLTTFRTPVRESLLALRA